MTLANQTKILLMRFPMERSRLLRISLSNMIFQHLYHLSLYCESVQGHSHFANLICFWISEARQEIFARLMDKKSHKTSGAKKQSLFRCRRYGSFFFFLSQIPNHFVLSIHILGFWLRDPVARIFCCDK